MEKLFYKIGEVSKITDLEPYVLRYWESEFNILAPNKSSSGRRQYERKDIDTILDIKRLLYDEKFSIEGAKRKLSKRINVNEKKDEFLNCLDTLKSELKDMLKILEG